MLVEAALDVRELVFVTPTPNNQTLLPLLLAAAAATSTTTATRTTSAITTPHVVFLALLPPLCHGLVGLVLVHQTAELLVLLLGRHL